MRASPDTPSCAFKKNFLRFSRSVSFALRAGAANIRGDKVVPQLSYLSLRLVGLSPATQRTSRCLVTGFRAKIAHKIAYFNQCNSRRSQLFHIIFVNPKGTGVPWMGGNIFSPMRGRFPFDQTAIYLIQD